MPVVPLLFITTSERKTEPEDKNSIVGTSFACFNFGLLWSCFAQIILFPGTFPLTERFDLW
jgi:hypothetical protein